MKIIKTDIHQGYPRIDALLKEHQLEVGMGTSTQKIQHTFEAFDGDDYLGGIACHITDQTMHIEMLALPPHIRTQGLGSTLVNTVLEFATEQNIIAVTVSTLEFQAKDFYLKLGFEIFGTLRNVPFEGTTKYFFVKYL